MVESLYLVPAWFYTLDIILGLVFAFILINVGTTALRINRLTKDYRYRLFGIAFILISFSYLVRTATNAFLSAEFNLRYIVDVSQIGLITMGAIYFFAFLFISGYVTFAYITINNRSKRNYFLMLVPSLIAFALSENNSMAIFLITIVFLIPIVYHYGSLYFKNNERRRLSMFFATFLLLISNVIFMFVMDYHFVAGYIISSVLELIAYSIIGISLFQILKHGQKKK
jgi:hypothetical protein